MRRLAESQIKVGVPLPFSVYDEQKNLLLGQGLTLTSERQMRSLLERGLFAEESAVAAASGQAPASIAPPPREPTSVVEQLVRIRRELNSILSERPIDPNGFCAKLLGLATRLRNVCMRDPDCCLAAMLVQRESRYAIRHMVHVAIVSEVIAEGAGLDESTRFSIIAAALTMNISMIDLQDALQVKQKTSLTDEQKEQIRQHPVESERMLIELGVDDPVWLSFVRDHHEMINGYGYPNRLSGASVPLGAQIISLADNYTARLDPRADRDAKTPGMSVREIVLTSGKAVDPMLAALLVKRIGIYPPGSIVDLQNQEVAIVTRRTDVANAPEVHCILSPERTLYTRPIRRNTEKQPYCIRGHVPLDTVRVRFDPMQFWMKS